MNSLKVVFVSYDWEMEKVNGLKKCPVIRIYGYILPEGEPCCIRIQEFFPHFYCLVTENNYETMVKLIEENKEAYGVVGDGMGNSIVKTELAFLYDIYGYHPDRSKLLRVSCYHPADVQRIAAIIHDRVSLSKVYDVHIPYLLQFLVEVGLQGMSCMVVDLTKSRIPTKKVSRCLHEFIVPFGAISPDDPIRNDATSYPLPSPLAPSNADEIDGLVCSSCLNCLWEEEAVRSMGKTFPYKPEHIPGESMEQCECKDMPQVLRLQLKVQEAFKQETAELVGSLSSTPILSTPVDNTPLMSQMMSQDENDEMERDNDFSNDEEEESDDSPEDTPLTNEQAGKAEYWPTEDGKVLIFAPPPRIPLDSLSQMNTLSPPSQGRLSLTGNSLPALLSQEKSKVLPVEIKDNCKDDSDVEDKDLSYCTLLVLDLITKEGCEDIIGVVACLRDLRNSHCTDQTLFFLVSEDISEFEESSVFFSSTERDLLITLNEVLFSSFDPQVLMCWDARKKTLLTLKRRSNHWGLSEFEFSLSRLVHDGHCFQKEDEVSSVKGRIVLDLWRLLRSHESGLNLTTTSLHGCVQLLLGLTIPSIPTAVISRWLIDSDKQRRQLAMQVLNRQVMLQLTLLDSTGILDRAVEMARIYGMDVSSVFSRGSQYRVECMLSRVAKRAGYVLVSSSKKQVQSQPALEGVPMVLEPKSGFYEHPVCVLDFQSLYPSIIIAYNMCYSTCIGRPFRTSTSAAMAPLGTQFWYNRPSWTELDNSKDSRVIGTCADTFFVGKETRVGLLPRMLHEVIQTRFMVKKAMKVYDRKASHETKSNRNNVNRSLIRKLDARQLTLKMLANVTYGYTGAAFSGRMPFAELADAIVLTARSTLEAAMQTAERLGGEIIYGDTDSLFVLYRGSSVEEAFKKGQELADMVTRENPWPMKLQLEKVYWPCLLVTKKRYVGRAFYDSDLSIPPKFDAKGIETVRRDNCPLVSKSVSKVLNELFSLNCSPLKPIPSSYPLELILKGAITKVIHKIISGEINTRNFIFQNQIKDEEAYKQFTPAARVAQKTKMVFQKGLRVAYVIADKGPSSLLTDRASPPSDIVSGKYVLDFCYYVFRQLVPALKRNLGIRLSKQVDLVISTIQQNRPNSSAASTERLNRIDTYVEKRSCPNCRSPGLVCPECSPAEVHKIVGLRMKRSEQSISELRRLCLSCAGSADAAIACKDAYHCSVYFEREEEQVKYTRIHEEFMNAGNYYSSLDW